MDPRFLEHLYGGREGCIERLFDLGLLDPLCKKCQKRVKPRFVGKRFFPRTYCPECHNIVESCRNGSIFEAEKIEFIPAFLFVLDSVLLRTPMNFIQRFSGLQPETARKYVGVVRDMMADTTRNLYRSWEGQLGGPGKVVEIDEAILTTNKNHVGRLQAKQGVIVFGITERDGGYKTVSEELYAYLVAKEAWRKSKERPGNNGGLRPPQTRRRGGTNTQPAEEALAEEEEMRQVVLGEDDEEDGDDDWAEEAEEAEEPAPEHAAQGTVPFQINPDMEKAERELFGPDKKTQPHRTLFFVVPDRSAETLLPIIRKYVAPESIVFSDAWPAYNRLRPEYDHFTVVHKRRFVQYHFPLGEERVVLKITTNHIERMWVEMRRDLRGVLKSEVAKRLDEVPYRLFRLATGSEDENFKNAAADMAVYGKKRCRENEAKRRREAQQRELEQRGPMCVFQLSTSGTVIN